MALSVVHHHPGTCLLNFLQRIQAEVHLLTSCLRKEHF
jgi:hypothetical protein